MKLLIINGPNMNMLGIREPELYGNGSYADLLTMIKEARSEGNELAFFQSNSEGDLIDAIQRAYYEHFDGIVINPAAYTHTSIAILDALKAVKIPYVEVHISEPKAREEFRQHSYFSEDALACISGRGFAGYIEAIDVLVEKVQHVKRIFEV